MGQSQDEYLDAVHYREVSKLKERISVLEDLIKNVHRDGIIPDSLKPIYNSLFNHYECPRCKHFKWYEQSNGILICLNCRIPFNKRDLVLEKPFMECMHIQHGILGYDPEMMTEEEKQGKGT